MECLLLHLLFLHPLIHGELHHLLPLHLFLWLHLQPLLLLITLRHHLYLQIPLDLPWEWEETLHQDHLYQHLHP
jgi:hypothetical protein